MKIRTGFVSNSSSSSFVCNVCERKHYVWEDEILFSNLIQCQNNHIFCTEHALVDIFDREYLYNRFIKDFPNLKRTIVNMDFDNTKKILSFIDDYYYPVFKLEEMYCPICSKRDYNYNIYEIIKYLSKENPAVINEIVDKYSKEINTLYKTHGEFIKKYAPIIEITIDED